MSQKLNPEILKKLAENNATAKEIDWLLMACRYQDDYGRVQGVYYKEFCEEIGLSYQGFYDCKAGLERKGIIEVYKNNYFDIDIVILNNVYANYEDLQKGYINTHEFFLRTENFKKLKARAKIMCLWLYGEWKVSKKKKSERYASSYIILKDNFMKKFKSLWPKLSERAIRGYLGQLKPFMNIYLEDGRKYYLTFKESVLRQSQRLDSENEENREHIVEVSIRRNRVVEVTSKEKRDLQEILRMQLKKINKLLVFDFDEIIANVLKVINCDITNVHKWKRKLNIALVQKTVTEYLNQAAVNA